MTSLTDVYEGNVGRVASRRQQLLGSALFLVGGSMVVGAIALATTNVGVQSLGRYPARELAGVLAGLGLPAVLLGVFAVLPASRSVRGAAIVGTGITAIGVAMFQHVYPYDWVTAAPLLTLATTAVYFFGVVTIFWCLFVALATFKTRNDPGGTARMEITRQGTIQLVEEARSLGRFGGVGLFGTDLDGEVETQTNRETASTGHDGATVTGATRDDSDAADDGGSPAADRRSADATQTESFDPIADTATGYSRGLQTEPSADGGEVIEGDGTVTGGAAFSNDVLDSTSDGDENEDSLEAYCGNCRHFEYVMEDGESRPYCQLHERTMDDLDACSSWLER
ncbi:MULTISPECIES: DUF7139 domain-containing protein [Halomicrobium]|uniref:Uncharacterized protein n=2 Tax=Halomicrobium mukohataei TaxID=57705 RepID=C7P2H8_HALMD|nr:MULTISPECIES: hypothetical protein [Halomicrobium]ACV49293.1 conserved hypothetical protein [Halomicrobium mukohataei DSM 12286]QCD64692.1 hypothetical protein E5139_03170 [Halomicrobium mukohataei]QFR19499.1 hypothetical protein GBQ70_03170 [Halomicrobium sp. ZPS1]